jgi:hypothetical protein
MMTPARALLVASLLLLPAVGPANAAPTLPDTNALQFLGFRAGARLDELDAQLRRLGGAPLRCRRSKVDPRVSECRAKLTDPALSGVADIWVSAIDSAAGIITISGAVLPERLELWRQALRERYGMVGTRVQGSQSMLQWVRRGRMMRLTWRLEGSGKVASVSLVDGRVLDDWARSRSSSPAVAPRGSRTGSLSS